MISQDKLIREEQAILNKVIAQLDNAMLKENSSLTRSKLEYKKAKDMCLPDTYGSLVKALNDEENAKRNLKKAKKIKDELYDTRLELECRDIYSSGAVGRPDRLDLKVGLHTYCRGEEIIVISWVRPVCRHYMLDNSSEEYEGIVTGKNGRKYRTLYTLKLKRRVDIFFDKVKSVSHMLRSIKVKGKTIVFVYEYCLSRINIVELALSSGTIIVNLHNWNGEGCISKEAYSVAESMGIKLLTMERFYPFIRSLRVR